MGTTRSLGPAAGVLAPLTYGATVVFGAASIPGYSHLQDSISSLTERGRTGVVAIDVAFILYNCLVGGFSISMLRRDWSDGAWRTVYCLLLLTAICGVLMWAFRQDPVGTPATSSGSVHIVLAAIESISTVVILVIATLRCWSSREPRLAAFVLSLLLCVLIFGAAAAMATTFSWPLMGLYERLTIGSFEVWILATAVRAGRQAWVLADNSSRTYNPGF